MASLTRVGPPITPRRIGGNSQPTLLTIAVFVAVFGTGCAAGGGSTSSSSSSSGSTSNPAPPFQARSFPGDYFMRLPSPDGYGNVPSEAYYQPQKELFVSNPDVNGVEVYSTQDGHWIGEIAVPGPAGLDFSPDFSKLFIGTITPYLYIADPKSLHITSRIAIPPSLLTTNQGGTTLTPIAPYPMADGSILVGMGATPESGGSAYVFSDHLVRYDPSSGGFTQEDPAAYGLLAMPSRSQDGKYVVVSSGPQLYVFSAETQGYVASSTPLPDTCTFLAVNQDGSQFASIQQVPAPGTFNSQINFWSSTLQSQSQYTITGVVNSAVFSRDGKFLYLPTQNGMIVVLNSQTGTPAGYLGLSIGSIPIPEPGLFDIDENNHLFGGVQPSGAFILNAVQLQSLPPAVLATFIGPSTEANPNVGPVSGGTQVQFIPTPAGSGSADGIASSMQAYFGSQPATQDAVGPYESSSDGENFLTATAPAVTTPGPVSVVLTDANSNTVFLPDAYTYGPHLLRVMPNAASTSGGDQITIFAYGLGFYGGVDLSQTDLKVTIGGASVNMHDATLNSYASFDYPEQSLTVPVPPGTAGWADVKLTTSNGSDILPRAIQYLNQEVTVPGGSYGFAVYDSLRDRFYMTGNGNGVAVFNPQNQSLDQPLQSSSIGSGAVLQSEAMTPDNSKLLVSDPADKSVIVFDLVAGTSSSVKLLSSSDPSITLSAPMSVVTAANNRAFVSLTPCIQDPVREIDLTNMTVQARPDAASTCANYVPYLPFGGSSADGSVIIFAGNSGEEPPGAEYIWRYDASTDVFTGPVLVQDTPWVAGKAAANSDGSVIALSQGTLDQNLQPLVPFAFAAWDSRLNETGSLLYTVDDSGPQGTILLSDTRNGRMLLSIVLPTTTTPILGPYRPLAIDPSGQKILVATMSGISYYELSVAPLSVGVVSPAQGSGGTSITVRGSGFVSGTSVTIGGQTAACTLVDTETLSCTVPNLSPGFAPMTLTNPDGQMFSFENAFLIQ